MISYLIKKIQEKRYALGLIKTDQNLSSQLPKQIKWVSNTPSGLWYADPFIYKITNDEIHIFVEEFKYKTGKGVISLVVIDKNKYRFKRSKVLLDLPTHLSYPYIKRENGVTYVLPENYQSGSLKMYVYDDEKEILIIKDTVLNYPVTDAIFISMNNIEYILSTVFPDPNGKVCCLFRDGNKVREILFSSNVARGAGSTFIYQGKLYRPCQDCEGAYGKGVVIFELDNSFQHKEVCRLYPASKRNALGLHTFNIYDDYIAVDGLGYRHYVIGTVFSFLKKIIKLVIRK